MKATLTFHGRWARIQFSAAGDAERFLSPASLASLHSALEAVRSKQEIRCLMLEVETCFGARLDEISAANPAAMRHAAEAFVGLLQNLHAFPAAVICWARGRLCGGAVGIAAACDIILCEPGASFSLPEASLGIAPILIAPWLTRRIGAARFRAWALSGMEFQPEAACHIGLADGHHDGPGFPPAYARILRSSPAAFASIKRLSCLESTPPSVDDFMNFVSEGAVQDDLVTIAGGGSPEWRLKGHVLP